MTHWTGFIDLLALRHSASIDDTRVEVLLDGFFQTLTQVSQNYAHNEISVDILSDSAVIVCPDLYTILHYSRLVRAELFTRNVFFKMGLAEGRAEITRYPVSETNNFAGTFFRGAPGLTAYAAQSQFNGAGIIFSKAPKEVAVTDPKSSGVIRLCQSFYIDRRPGLNVVPYVDVASLDYEIGPNLSSDDFNSSKSEDDSTKLVRNDTVKKIAGLSVVGLDNDAGRAIAIRNSKSRTKKLAIVLDQGAENGNGNIDNSALTYFDSVMDEMNYTRSLDRQASRKYLSILFNILSSADIGNLHFDHSGNWSGFPPSYTRLFLRPKYSNKSVNDEVAILTLYALSRIVDLKLKNIPVPAKVDAILDNSREIFWLCSYVGASRKLFGLVSIIDRHLMPMHIKDLLVRGAIRLGYTVS